MRSRTKEPPDLKFVWMTESNLQAKGIQKVDNPIHWIKLNSVDSVVGIQYTYPLDNDLFGLLRYKTLNKRGQNCTINVMDKRTSLTVRSSHVKDRCSS